MKIGKLIKRLQELEQIDPTMEVVIEYRDCGGDYFAIKFANVISWIKNSKKIKAVQIGFKDPGT